MASHLALNNDPRCSGVVCSVRLQIPNSYWALLYRPLCGVSVIRLLYDKGDLYTRDSSRTDLTTGIWTFQLRRKIPNMVLLF
jgi:hypothetical protein